MPGRLHDFLSRDHERLDRLLVSCRAPVGEVDERSYTEFRGGLLRHIAIEERVLFPELRRQRGTTPLEARLHREHALLAALLVPPPTRLEIEQIVHVLETHNVLEESAGGLYDIIETIAGDDLESLMSRVEAVPPVRLAPNADSPILRVTIAQLLRDVEEGRQAPI